jgi:hypothetical protein
MQQIIQKTTGLKENNVKLVSALVDRGTNKNDEKIKHAKAEVPKDEK